MMKMLSEQEKQIRRDRYKMWSEDRMDRKRSYERYFDKKHPLTPEQKEKRRLYMREYLKTYVYPEATLEKRRTYLDRRFKDRKALIDRMKMKPCLDCGVQYNPWIMQFDHRPGEVKLFGISLQRNRNEYSIEKVTLEIAKCDVVCSNCHHDRTHKRRIENTGGRPKKSISLTLKTSLK